MSATEGALRAKLPLGIQLLEVLGQCPPNIVVLEPVHDRDPAQVPLRALIVLPQPRHHPLIESGKPTHECHGRTLDGLCDIPSSFGH